MAEFSTTKITPSDGVQIPSINGQVAGYQENDELKAYVLGTIPTDVSGHTADIAGIRGTSLDYDPDSTTYIKGATCILNHIVYRAKQLIPSPAGTFDSSKWEEVSLHEIARKVATNTENIEANTEAITSLMTLSTTEKIVGYDTDGSTIYEKTYKGTLDSATYTIIDASFTPTLYSLVSFDGALDKGTFYMQLGCFLNSNYYSGAYMSATGLAIYNSNELLSAKYLLTVRYKKN